MLNEAWEETPPVAWLVAAYLGYESPQKKRDEALANTRMMLDRILASGGEVPIR